MKEDIAYLFQAYLQKTGTPEEKAAFLRLVAGGQSDEELKELLDGMLAVYETEHSLEVAEADDLFGLIRRQMTEQAPAAVIPMPDRRFGWLRIAGAAVLIIVCTGIVFLLMNRKGEEDLVRQKPAIALPDDAAPGSNRAVLQLADGSSILLDTAADGMLAHESAVDILKTDSGQLTYRRQGQTTGALSYNSITTPRGGQFRVTLPDGSKVWLNAASSLRFPTAFQGEDRTVELTGEGYFEVAQNASMPFLVKTANVAIRVLGTNFDVNAYSNEPFVRTTLLEGKVKVSTAGSNCVLQPGQQAECNEAGSLRVVNDADTGETMAWKNGLFHFEEASIETVMRQVERWYDLDVVYQGPRPKEHYRGEIPRDVRASEMLKVLMAGGAHFRIEGKKIIVTQ